MNELRHHHQVTSQHKYGSRVAGCATVVCGAEQCDQVSLGKTLKAIHDTLMSTHDHLQVVGLHVYTNTISQLAAMATC